MRELSIGNSILIIIPKRRILKILNTSRLNTEKRKEKRKVSLVGSGTKDYLICN